MIRRISFMFMLVLAVVAVQAVPALAADEVAVAQALADRGYFLESGVDIDGDEASELVAAARREGSAFHMVVLSDEPDGGATFFAEQVFNILDNSNVVSEGVIVVFTPLEVGYFAKDDIFDSNDLDGAADVANNVGGDDRQYATAFLQGLGVDVGVTATTQATATTVAPATGSTPSSGGGSGFLWFVIIGGLALLVWWMVRRSSKKRTGGGRVDMLTEAKGEIRSQLAAVANDVLDLEDRVRVADNDEADQYYQQAAATYSSASDVFEKATQIQQLETVSDALDDAAWQLDAAEAILEGRPVPPKPPKEQPGRCFFDPTHRPPYEEATIETSAGNKTVNVCRVDGAKLRQGRMPDSRMINVGGRRVPASQAPRTHGGLGMGGMDLLNILIGGVGMAMGNRNRGRGRGRSGGGGLLGGLLGGGRSSSRSSRSSSRSSGGGVLPGPSRRSGGLGSTRSSSRSSNRSSRSSSRAKKTGRSRGGKRRR